MKTKSIIVLVGLSILNFGMAQITAPGVINPEVKPGWSMVFQDEFNGAAGSSVDLTKWDKVENMHGENPNTSLIYERAFYRANGTNFEMTGNSLKIKCIKENYLATWWENWELGIQGQFNYQYTSGEIVSKVPYHYGYYEIRCKLPKGESFWPAFWNFSSPWNEIDFYENIMKTRSDFIGTNYHVINPSNTSCTNPTDGGQDILVSGDITTDFYTIGVDWTPTSITWYVNNVFARTVTTPQCNLFVTNPCKIILNLALEGFSQGQHLNKMNTENRFPGAFEIDYVRIYQRNCNVIQTVPDFCIQQGFNNNEDRPRLMGDVNGDGNDDIVAFGWNYTLVSLSNGNGTFGSPQYTSQNFTKEQNYTTNNTRPRFLADVNKDGKMDIIGFGINNTYVALSTSLGSVASFSSPVSVISNNYTVEQGWINQSVRPRMLADVNGDGKPDIIGFGYNFTIVSLNTTPNGSSTPSFKSTLDYVSQNYTLEQSYTNMETMPRMMADVNGDKKADIVAFNNTHTYVSINTTPNNGTTASYGAPIIAYQNDFTTGFGYNTQEERPRMFADVNGDGKDDLIAFGNTNTFVAISDFPLTNKFKTKNSVLANFTKEQGWASQNAYPRFVKDINNDGKADIIGFGGGEVKISLNKTLLPISAPSFAAYQNVENDFCNAQGWLDQNQYPRYLAKINGDCIPDVVGFGLNKVYTKNCLSDAFCGTSSGSKQYF
jgi:beta-glucanase (GH16 family)